MHPYLYIEISKLIYIPLRILIIYTVMNNTIHLLFNFDNNFDNFK
jgi:hypothetical protein